MTPVTFQPKNSTIEAVRYMGEWRTAQEVFNWTEGRTFLVPRGYDHATRKPSEKDHSRGDILEDAPPYILLCQNDGAQVRVDIYDWIAKDWENKFFRISRADMESKYDQGVDV